MGTEEGASNEWIELLNKDTKTIPLEGFFLLIGDKEIPLEGHIEGDSFFILERSDDNTLPKIPADQIFSGSIKNSGEAIKLIDKDKNIIDEADFASGWNAGNNETKQTAERIDDGWQDSLKIGGSPNEKNIEYEKPKNKSSSEIIVLNSSSSFPFWTALALSVLAGIIIVISKKSLEQS